MNFSDLLGGLVQTGMTPSSNDRLRNAIGGGGAGGDDLLESLSGMLGGGQGGGLGGALSGMLGGGKGGGLGGALSGMLGGGGGGGLGGLLGSVLGQAGSAVGGKDNLALGGLGALAGALLGGGGKSMGGALGGGLMAMLGAMAFKALKGSGSQEPAVPLGLRKPQTEEEENQLEQNAELVLRAMINAAKADGRIDETEIERIIGKLKEMGADSEHQQFVIAQMQKPPETEALISAARGRPELGVQIYAASLMAIEVDTPAEKAYMDSLASGLGLTSQVSQNIHQMVGLGPA
jgi:uncharacterized membrane protein YebE (DUF533 family)